MSHQQKLVYIQEIPAAGANGALVVTPGFHLDDVRLTDSYHVARHEVKVEIIGADPSNAFRWWTTNVGVTTFTFNWAGLGAGCTIRLSAHVFHSICFDISTAQPPY